MTSEEIKIFCLITLILIFVGILVTVVITIEQLKEINHDLKDSKSIHNILKGMIDIDKSTNDVVAYLASYGGAIYQVLEEKKILTKRDKNKILKYRDEKYNNYKEGKKNKCKDISR